MARYGQYGNFYDPVGSHANQPSGYTFQTNPSAATYPSTNATAGYGATYNNYGNNAYGTQQYDASQQQKSSSDVMASSNHNPSLFREDGNSTGYATGGVVQQQARMQNNSSPLHASRQPSINSIAGTQNNYPGHSGSGFSNQTQYRDTRSNAPSNDQTVQGPYTQQPTQQPQQQPPQRYQSPLHALQASQHQRQPSRGSTQLPSPQMANAGRSSQPNNPQQTNTTPSSVTVNPSHIYDNRAELQRQAMYDAERRKKREVEQAAKKAEEERAAAEEAERRKVQEEQRKVAEEERQRAEAARQKAEQDAAKEKEAQNKNNEQRRKAREEKMRSNTAATALQQLSSSAVDPATSNSTSNPDENDEEQMRALFKRMREFNAKNPAMLAKLWEEERTTHMQGQSSPPAAQFAIAPPTAKGKSSKQAKQSGTTAKSLATERKAQATINTSMEQPMAPVQQPPTPSPAAPLSQAQPPKGKGAAVGANAQLGIWPNHNKGLIAEAAGKWLESQRLNTGKSISKEAVLEILNSGPSYVQLCGILEGQGWKFDRTKFARELLKASPDLSKFGNSKGAGSAVEIVSAGTSAGASNGQSQKLNGGPSSQTNSATPVNAAASPAPAVQHPHQGPTHHDSLNTGPSPAPQDGQASHSSQQAEVKTDALSHASPPRPPADKEEAARKRTFGDLVDLTAQDSDDEDAPPPLKNFKPSVSTGEVTRRPFVPFGAPPPQRGGLWQPLAFSQFMRRAPGQFMPNPAFTPNPPILGSSPAMDRPPHIMPQQPPPSATPKPGSAPAPPAKRQGPSLEHQQHARMRGKMLVEPIMRDRVVRRSTYDKRTIARDVLLATGRHPDMRGLNAHMVPMQKLLGDHGGQIDHEGRQNLKCDLTTIKWDIIDPGEPRGVRTSAEPKEDENAGEPGHPTDGVMHDDADGVHDVRDEVSQWCTGHTRKKAKKTFDENGQIIPKKKGRPRKSDVQMTNQNLGNADPHSQSFTPTNAAAPPTSNLTSLDVSAMSSPIGYAAFNQINVTTSAKKKGRPFGWRKNVHSRAAQGLPPATAHSSPLPRRENTAAATKPQQQQPPVEPNYQVYKCRWTDCNAQLHNLDTLKKHVIKLHGRPSSRNLYECSWRGCGEQLRPIELWCDHVDSKHLQQIAWKLGDGPRAGSVSDTVYDFESYLSDARGRSVTPIISPAPVPSNALPSEANEQRPTSSTISWPKRVGRPPLNPIERTPVQSLQDLEKHKRAVGSVLDRQGCILASEERRRYFLEDEDFEAEVYGSEHDDRG